MRYPASLRHYYEKADKHPDGFLVTGDALCSFNPVYGRGMTVAALEAAALARILAKGTASLPARFYAAAAKVIHVAWDLAAGGDRNTRPGSGPSLVTMFSGQVIA